ncbi:MAG: DUF4249 domain-containing protein [Fulvivirga sp.]
MCLEQIDLEQIGTEDLLVVDAMITDQLEIQQVKLTRTVALNSNNSMQPESNAQIWIEGNDNTRIDFIEDKLGTYKTEQPFAAKQNTNYTLRIITNSGREYQSATSIMTPTSPIDSVYAEFESFPTVLNSRGGFFNFYVDTRSNTQNNKYFRWFWYSTFEVVVPTPSRWLWTGGNTYVIRERGSENDSLQVEICYNSDTIRQINVKSLLEGEQEVIRQPISRFHSDSASMKRRYSILVKQYALSEESYRFWSLIDESTNQGSLFDIQVGTIQGNISNVNDGGEIVLGFFEVVQAQSVRRFYTPRDFRNTSFREFNPNVVSCSDEEPIAIELDKIGEFMEANKEYYTLCYFTTFPPAAIFCKIRCAVCTEYANSNNKPDYW